MITVQNRFLCVKWYIFGTHPYTKRVPKLKMMWVPKNEAENAIAPTEGYCVYCYFSHITTASRNKLPLCLKITALSLLLICHVISLASYL